MAAPDSLFCDGHSSKAEKGVFFEGAGFILLACYPKFFGLRTETLVNRDKSQVGIEPTSYLNVDGCVTMQHFEIKCHQCNVERIFNMFASFHHLHQLAWLMAPHSL